MGLKANVEICQNENFFASALFLRVWVIYGGDHRILCTCRLQKKSHEVATAGRIREGDFVQLATKEVRLTPSSVENRALAETLRE
jgi:hypothetical protein